MGFCIKSEFVHVRRASKVEKTSAETLTQFYFISFPLSITISIKKFPFPNPPYKSRKTSKERKNVFNEDPLNYKHANKSQSCNLQNYLIKLCILRAITQS